jgi:cysteine desulfurase
MSVKRPVYLDHHATTPVDPRVVDAMMPYFNEHFGNATSKHHQYGWTAEAAVEKARSQVAQLIGAQPNEVIFTSGATESINLAIKGIAEFHHRRGNHLVTVATEHRAVLDVCKRLESAGFIVTYLPVDKSGLVSPDDVLDALTGKTILVSIMHANNEIGTVAPVAEIGALCRERGVMFHVDAAQSAGKATLNARKMNVDLLSLSAHKMYGPKGVGALYVRDTVRLVPQVDGGGHERGLRSGTLNVPGIVGFGAAAEIASQEMPVEAGRVRALRDRLVQGITSQLDDVVVNGHPDMRLPNNASITFGGVQADRIIMDMKDVSVSTGSACSSVSPHPSHVLQAIGLSKAEVLSTVRFGLGRFTTVDEIEYAIERVVSTVRSVRERTFQPSH